MDLTPVQRERLQTLIEDELRRALAHTDTATAGAFLTDRRRVLEQSTADDRQDPLDQDGHGGGITQQG